MYTQVWQHGITAKLSIKQDFDLEQLTSSYLNSKNDAVFCLSGLIYLVSAPASPLLGLLMDKTGRNITWVILAILASIGCHSLLAFTRWMNVSLPTVSLLVYALLLSFVLRVTRVSSGREVIPVIGAVFFFKKIFKGDIVVWARSK